MKKISSLKKGMQILAGVSVFALSVSFYACSVFSNMEVPEKISVKSDAKFSVAIGEKSVDMNDIFGSSLQESIAENAEGLEVFKYVPDKNNDTLQYLLHSNIYNFDLDIAEQLGNMNMDDMLNGEDGIDVDEKIQVPEIKSPDPQPFDDLNEYFVNGVASKFAGKATWEIKPVIEFEKNDYIKTAVIKDDATIDIKVAKPDGTNGVTLELSNLTITGAGLDFKAADFENVSDSNYLLFKTLSFKKLEAAKRTLDFSKGDIKINGVITVTIANGARCTGLNTEIAVNMKEIESATADFSKLVNFKKDETNGASKLPENMLKHVDKVTFGEQNGDSHYKHEAEGKLSSTKSEGLGIKCEIVNSLPAGNDIDITMTSKVFNITAEDSNSWHITSYGNESTNTELWSIFKDINFGDKTKFDPENPPCMDFEIKLSNNQKLTNLEFGKEYSLSIKNSQFVFDWDSAEVQLSELQDEPIEGDNDLSSLSKESLFGDLDGEIGEFIRDNIEFGENVKAYFYVQKPNDALGIGDITLSGTVNMIYTLNGERKIDPILQEDEFELSNAVKWKANKEKEFTTNLKNTKFVADYDMMKILQSGVEDTKLEYNIEIAGGKTSTIYKLALDNLNEDDSTSISIDAAIVFPLELKIKKGAKLDILKAADFDEDKEDMFDREKGSDDEYSKYLDYISFNYNLKNNVIKGFDFKIVIDDQHPEAEGKYSEIFSEFDGSEIRFSTGDAKKIFENLFMPKIYLKFDENADTNITISRSGLASGNSFSFSPVVSIKLNGDSPICINDIFD